MISKELMLIVLGYVNDCRVIHITEEQRDIKYDILSPVNGHYTERINKYELAHKCKEWAIKQGYVLESRLSLNKNHQGVCRIRKVRTFIEIICDTEHEAIFKACEWILENKEVK
jgi:hypothetical protein